MSEPELSEPELSEPHVSEPDVSDPHVSEPHVSDPAHPSGRITGVILYVGSFEVDPDERAAFVAGAQPHAAASRNDAGCLSFVIALDSNDPGRVHYVERWASREDLIAHGRATQERGLPPNPVAATSSGFELFEPGTPL